VKTILKITMALVLAGTLFTGCSTEDLHDTAVGAINDIKDYKEENFTEESSTDDFSIEYKYGGFRILWTKLTDGPGELIYTDGAEDTGIPMVADEKGQYILTCTPTPETQNDYDCTVSNNGTNQKITLITNVQYQWLISYGEDHIHGEVEAVTEYSDGVLTIE
jgi:hypothetical protein